MYWVGLRCFSDEAAAAAAAAPPPPPPLPLPSCRCQAATATAKLPLPPPSCRPLRSRAATALLPRKKREEGVRREVECIGSGCAVSAMKAYPGVL